jgi:hypothetical protein
MAQVSLSFARSQARFLSLSGSESRRGTWHKIRKPDTLIFVQLRLKLNRCADIIIEEGFL